MRGWGVWSDFLELHNRSNRISRGMWWLTFNNESLHNCLVRFWMWKYNPNLVSLKSNLNCLKRNVMWCSSVFCTLQSATLSKAKYAKTKSICKTPNLIWWANCWQWGHAIEQEKSYCHASAVCLLLVRIRPCNALLFVGSCSPLSLCKKAVALIQNCTVLAACCWIIKLAIKFNSTGVVIGQITTEWL